jgi:hypothetical protein
MGHFKDHIPAVAAVAAIRSAARHELFAVKMHKTVPALA